MIAAVGWSWTVALSAFAGTLSALVLAKLLSR